MTDLGRTYLVALAAMPDGRWENAYVVARAAGHDTRRGARPTVVLDGLRRAGYARASSGGGVERWQVTDAGRAAAVAA